MAYAAPRLRVTLRSRRPANLAALKSAAITARAFGMEGLRAQGEILFPFAPNSPIRAHLPNLGRTKGLAGRHPGLRRHTHV